MHTHLLVYSLNIDQSALYSLNIDQSVLYSLNTDQSALYSLNTDQSELYSLNIDQSALNNDQLVTDQWAKRYLGVEIGKSEVDGEVEVTMGTGVRGVAPVGVRSALQAVMHHHAHHVTRHPARLQRPLPVARQQVANAAVDDGGNAT